MPMVGGIFGEVRVVFSSWVSSSDNGGGFGLEFGQGSPCFRPFLPQGLMKFISYEDVSVSGGILVKVWASLEKLGVEISWF